MGVPTWMFHDTGDGVESAIFDSDDLPNGWRDTPNVPDKKATDSKEPKAKK